jgi:hypothetical protein
MCTGTIYIHLMCTLDDKNGLPIDLQYHLEVMLCGDIATVVFLHFWSSCTIWKLYGCTGTIYIHHMCTCNDEKSRPMDLQCHLDVILCCDLLSSSMTNVVYFSLLVYYLDVL